VAVDRGGGPAADASRPVVLIGFAEALAAIEATWSLQDAGFKVVAFCRAGTRPALRRARDVEVHEVPCPEVDAAATATAVRALCAVTSPTVLLPLDDHAVWVCSQLEDASVPLAGPAGDAADFALDKSLQIAAAVRVGLPVPPTQVLDELAEAAVPGYPVMVKPARALYHVKGALERPTGVVCADGRELGRAAARHWPGPLLVQPWIHGVGEGIFGHVGADGVIGWSAHRRIRMVNPQGSASSACCSVPVDEVLTGPSERFLNDIGWRGMFMLEFLRDSTGQAWFMELNGRPWGSMALARRRGFEYPAWTVQAALTPDFQPTAPQRPPDIRCRNLGLEIAHLMFVARGPQTRTPMEWPRMSRALRDVFSFTPGDRLYNWNRAQPDVLVADTWGTLRKYLKKMTRKRK
jgi:predicted ATP-grasp superfamily ATP-dependent carboligase